MLQRFVLDLGQFELISLTFLNKNNKLGSIPDAILESASAGALIKDIATMTVEDLVVIYAYADAIVETVRQPLIILGSDLTIKTANKAFFDTFKVTKEDTYGQKIFDLGNRQWDIAQLRELLLTILPRDTQFQGFELTHVFEGVGEKTMVLNARRIQLEKYKTELILLAIEDISERRITEKLKDNFIAVASHELRTPLSSIMLLTQALQIEAKKEGNADNIESLGILERQINRLSSIVDYFTDIYRVQTGKLKLSKSNFVIDELVDGVISMLKGGAEHDLIKIGQSSKAVYADKDKIEQVLINFVTNAIKYSPNADTIEISIVEQEKGVQVSVKDFGIGITAENLPRIKERFFRVQDELSTQTPGLGLGLHIANEILLDHGGEMKVESSYGKGSTFSFFLPS
jgi:signal transduction histidine kinase